VYVNLPYIWPPLRKTKTRHIRVNAVTSSLINVTRFNIHVTTTRVKRIDLSWVSVHCAFRTQERSGDCQANAKKPLDFCTMRTIMTKADRQPLFTLPSCIGDTGSTRRKIDPRKIRYRYWYGGIAVMCVSNSLFIVELLVLGEILLRFALDHHSLVTGDGLGSLRL
jgi:hypothetical protein